MSMVRNIWVTRLAMLAAVLDDWANVRHNGDNCECQTEVAPPVNKPPLCRSSWFLPFIVLKCVSYGSVLAMMAREEQVWAKKSRLNYVDLFGCHIIEQRQICRRFQAWGMCEAYISVLYGRST